MKRLIILVVLTLYPAASFGAVNPATKLSDSFIEADNYFAKEQYNEAIAVYQKILSADQENAQAVSAMGMVLMSLGQYDKALIFAGKAVSLRPDEATYQFRLGVVYGVIGEYDKAIENLLKASELKPYEPETYFNLGVAYWHEGQYDLALSAYKKFLAVHPGTATAHYIRGALEITRPNYAQEIVKCRELIDKNNSDLKAYESLGIAYGQIGQYGKAMESLKAAVNLSGDYAKGYYNLGVVSQKAGQGHQASGFFAKAVGLSPKYAFIFQNNSFISPSMPFDKEVGCLPKSVSPLVYVGFGDVYYNMGLVYCQKKDVWHLKEQIAELEKLARYELIDDLIQCAVQAK